MNQDNPIKNPNKWYKSLPNQLTLLRIMVVPILMILVPLEIEGINLFCGLLFMLAAITDWLDGYIARKFNMESKIGALLDPVADKIIVTVALILLSSTHVLWTWMTCLFIAREIAINGLRLIAIEQNMEIPVSSLGKAKTITQDIAIVCLLINQPLWGIPIGTIGMLAIWAAFGLSIYSAYLYITEFLDKY